MDPFDDAELRALYGIHATAPSSGFVAALRGNLQDVNLNRLFAVIPLRHAATPDIFVRQLQALVTPGEKITDDLVDACIWWFNTQQPGQGGIWVPHMGWHTRSWRHRWTPGPQPAPGAGNGPPCHRGLKPSTSHRTKTWRNEAAGPPR